MGARLKAHNREVLSIGWFGEYFAREKRLKALNDYFKKTEKQAPEQRVHEVTQMFERMIQRQADGDR